LSLYRLLDSIKWELLDWCIEKWILYSLSQIFSQIRFICAWWSRIVKTKISLLALELNKLNILFISLNLKTFSYKELFNLLLTKFLYLQKNGSYKFCLEKNTKCDQFLKYWNVCIERVFLSNATRWIVYEAFASFIALLHA